MKGIESEEELFMHAPTDSKIYFLGRVALRIPLLLELAKATQMFFEPMHTTCNG